MSKKLHGSVADMLAKVALFQDIKPEQLRGLARFGEFRSRGAGEVVFRINDAADGLYVVLAGAASITRPDDDGEEIELAAVGPGGFFGEMALLDGRPRSATVTVTKPTELWVLSREHFLDFIFESREVLSQLLSVMTGRIREIDARFAEAEFKKKRVKEEMELERMRSLSQMVAGVAHEVNTPLGIASTAISIIERALEDDAWKSIEDPQLKSSVEDVLEASSLIKGSVQRAHDLVKSFKNLSVRQLTDVKEAVQLPGLVDETLELFRARARVANIEISLENVLPSGCEEWVGFPGHLSRILLNLLQNVDRYAYPEGTGGRVEIRLECGPLDGTFLLMFRDFGRGIAPEHLPHIFEPFFTTGRGKGGAGLGLSIVANLVKDALKGSIAVASKPGEGATVTLTLPRVVPDERPASPVSAVT